MRITLHVVSVEDYPFFQHAMLRYLRAARLNDDRYRETGLSTEDADAIIDAVVKHTASPRTNAAMEAWLEGRYGFAVPRLWWALRHFAPVVHAPTGAPWAHGERAAYIGAPSQPPTGAPARSEQHLIRRYLEGFGPASAADIATFTFLGRPLVNAALEALTDELERVGGPGKVTLYDVPGGPARPRRRRPAAVVGNVGPDAARLRRPGPGPARRGTKGHRPTQGDVLPAVLVDGYVAGVWRVVDRGVEILPF
jgi:hypothetical protein